jgi:hypothetical protein
VIENRRQDLRRRQKAEDMQLHIIVHYTIHKHLWYSHCVSTCQFSDVPTAYFLHNKTNEYNFDTFKLFPLIPSGFMYKVNYQ